MLRSSSEETSTKRTPRQGVGSTRTRASRSTTERATRTRAARKKTNEEQPETPVEREPVAPVRKAPTPLRERSVARKSRRNHSIIVAIIICLGVGASAVVGYTDRGQIDVNKTIEERNDRIRAGGGTPDDGTAGIVPVQNTNGARKADGGLKGLGIGTTPQPVAAPEETGSSTASTTDTTASTAEAVSEDDTQDSIDEAVDETSTEAPVEATQ